MQVKLTKPLEIDGKKIETLDLKLEDLTGRDILKVDAELRSDGDPRGFDNIFNQKVLLKIAAKASGILVDDLERLSAPDFLEVTFTVRNFLVGLSDQTEEQENLGEFSSN